LDAYLYALVQAKLKVFKEVLKMTGDMTAVDDVRMETGILPKWINLGREEGYIKGREEGWAKGREEERQRGARKLKQIGVSPDIIAAGFGLSFEVIEKL
jgi:hypothetical protein